jgi:hypothetical protein
LIIRFGTLWFGVIVGLTALAMVSRRLSRAAKQALEAGEAAEPLASQPSGGARP